MNNVSDSEEKITFIVDNELKKEIDGFKKEMHISTRSEAVRQLIVKGLTIHEREKREQKYG